MWTRSGGGGLKGGGGGSLTSRQERGKTNSE